MTNKTFLRKVTLFTDLSEVELRALESEVKERAFRKNEVIFHEDDPGRALFILKKGRVKVGRENKRGREVILRILEPGDFFGEMSLLDEEPRSATVTALDGCQVLILFREAFVAFVSKHPRAVLRMLTVLSQRLRKANEKISRLVFTDAYEKVASVLMDVIKESKIPLEIGAEVPLRLSRKELADLAGLSRETFSRIMARFERAGLLRVNGRQLSVVDPARIMREAMRQM
jgi:CRP/FNR family transcriptional regulator, cyclic AMP receptor protein